MWTTARRSSCSNDRRGSRSVISRQRLAEYFPVRLEPIVQNRRKVNCRVRSNLGQARSLISTKSGNKKWNERINGMKTKLYLKKDASPKFCRARQIPLALRSKVEEEIQHQVSAGILEPTSFLQERQCYSSMASARLQC